MLTAEQYLNLINKRGVITIIIKSIVDYMMVLNLWGNTNWRAVWFGNLHVRFGGGVLE